jgi:hypothetical protein
VRLQGGHRLPQGRAAHVEPVGLALEVVGPGGEVGDAGGGGGGTGGEIGGELAQGGRQGALRGA